MNVEDNGNNLAVVPTGLGDDQLLAVAAAAEKRIEAVNKIKKIALKVTNVRDWRNQGGNPYLQVSGSEKVARLFGISWRIDEPTREEHADGHFSYTVKGYFSMGTAEIEVLGTRSSTDPLFSRGNGADIPPSEIDRNDVKKSAVTNCLGNGITRLLGIRNLTWDDLKEAGINTDMIGKTEYGSSDPNAAKKLPNYGKHKGQPMDDTNIPIEDLRYYLSGAEKGIIDPEKARYKAANEKLRDALKAEIAKREGAAHAAREREDGAADAGEVAASHEAVVTQQGSDAPAPPSTDPQEYITKIKLSESVRECSQVLNDVLDDNGLSAEDRAALQALGKQRLKELGKK